MNMAICRYPHFQTVPFGSNISVLDNRVSILLLIRSLINFSHYILALIAFGSKILAKFSQMVVT
jgi:hypothetical protein